MEYQDLIRERYSCRAFDGRPVEEEALERILEAGRVAPTAKNLQEQRVYVVESAEDLAKVDELTRCRYGAGTVLVVAFDAENVFTYPGGERDSGVEDATIVATHMILAAKDAGVESLWVNLINPAEVKAAFGLPQNEEVLCLMPLGYPTEEAHPSSRHADRKPLSETVARI